VNRAGIPLVVGVHVFHAEQDCECNFFFQLNVFFFIKFVYTYKREKKVGFDKMTTSPTNNSS